MSGLNPTAPGEDCAQSETVTLLCDDDYLWILAGPDKNRDVFEVVDGHLTRLRRSGYTSARIMDIRVRPWWRFWRSTRAVVILRGPRS